MGRAGSMLPALVTATVACAQVGHSSLPDASSGASTAACPNYRAMPSGGCCPAGQAWSADAKVCAAAGPAECAAVSPQNCTPRWCAPPLEGAEGALCAVDDPACALHPRLCSAAELADGHGCRAGELPWPDPHRSCGPAGSAIAAGLPDGSTLTDVARRAPADVPDVQPLAPLADSWFCHAAQTDNDRLCSAAEAKLCQTAPATACRRAGVAWLNGDCPPGFVADGTAPLAPCRPDPADCGTPPYGSAGGGASGPTIFADAVAGADSNDGSMAKPVQTLSHAVALLAGKGTVVLAAGSYAASVVATKALIIAGRCAAKVTLVAAANGPALLASGNAAAPLIVRGVTVTGEGFGPATTAGGYLSLQRVFIHAVHYLGVNAQQDGAQVTISESVIANVQPRQSDGGFGQGLSATHGAGVTLTDVRLMANVQAGVTAFDPGTTVTATRMLVDATLPRMPQGNVGCGVSAYLGAQVALSQVRLSHNRQSGLLAVGAATQVSAERLLVDHTLPRALDGKSGVGATAAQGAHVDLKSTRISANNSAGLVVSDAGSKLTATGVLVDGTVANPDDAQRGIGAMAVAQGQLVLTNARISDCKLVGVMLADMGSVGTLTAVLVDGTASSPQSGELGVGAMVTTGAKLQWLHGRVSGSHTAGIVINDLTTTASLAGLLIDGTLPQANDGANGIGLIVGDGPHVLLRYARLTGNLTAGLLVHGNGTVVTAHGVRIDGTRPLPGDTNGGIGLVVQDGAKLSLAGSTLHDNAALGLAAIAAGDIAAVGVLITATRANGDSQLGNGAFFDVGVGATSLAAWAVQTSHSAALAFHGGTATLANCVLAQTQVATYPTFGRDGTATGQSVSLGDGLVAANVLGLTIADTLLVGNPRAGMLLKDCGKVAVDHSLATGGLFGLVATGTTQTATHFCGLFGTQQNVAGDLGLLVPDVPKLAKPSN